MRRGLGAVVLLLALGACAAPSAPDSDPATATEPPRPRPTVVVVSGPVAEALDGLAVKGRAPMTGYDRDRFGPEWLDADRNGCDTRNDVLRRDLTGVRLDPATHGCVVLTGVLADPYTGQRIDFVRGDGFLVDIDHVVSLGDAWATGADRWSVLRRAAFANDPLNLLAVDAGANRSKGDSDAASWLPPVRGYRCAFVARQVAVKAKYGLWVTRAEADAVRRVLARCADEPLPPDSGAPTEVDQDITDPGAP